MQKGLCYAALTIAVVVFVCFLWDLVFGLIGSQNLAPFHYADKIADIVFIVCALLLAVLSWFTLKEQV